MNIYISKENEKRLRAERSMSGLVNRLLEEYYNSVPANIPAPPSKKEVSKSESSKNPAEKKSGVYKAKLTVCREHLVDKNVCKLMKHTGTLNYR